jgi:hypothetical protein
MSLDSTREPIIRYARDGHPLATRGHSTPDPESPPSDPDLPPSVPVPDDEPGPEYAPVKEPTQPEPPIRA